jgi:hypothetical protein
MTANPWKNAGISEIVLKNARKNARPMNLKPEISAGSSTAQNAAEKPTIPGKIKWKSAAHVRYLRVFLNLKI